MMILSQKENSKQENIVSFEIVLELWRAILKIEVDCHLSVVESYRTALRVRTG